MSLNWNSSKCAAYIAADKFDTESDEWKEYVVLRDTLVFTLMPVGFPSKSEWAITESNWQQVYMRLNIYERAAGAMRLSIEDNVKQDVFITPAEVHSMIGLAVNVGNKSDAEFKKMIFERLVERPSNEVENFEASL